jgi:chromosome segregation ATPase
MSYTSSPAVVSALNALNAKKAEIKAGEQNVETLEGELADLQVELAETKALEEIGDATAQDVTDAETAVSNKEDELATARSELIVDHDAVALLEDKWRAAVRDAKAAERASLESTYATELQAAVDAVAAARAALSTLSDTGTKLDAYVRSDRRPQPFIHGSDTLRVVSSRGDVRFPNGGDDFLARAARAGVTPS